MVCGLLDSLVRSYCRLETLSETAMGHIGSRGFASGTYKGPKSNMLKRIAFGNKSGAETRKDLCRATTPVRLPDLKT